MLTLRTTNRTTAYQQISIIGLTLHWCMSFVATSPTAVNFKLHT